MSEELPPKAATPPASVSPIIEGLFKHIIGPLNATGVGVLTQEPEQSDERVHALVKVFEQHHEWIEPFTIMVKSLKAQEVQISLEEQIRRYTTKNSRFWLAANLFSKVLKTKELALDVKTGRMSANPQDLLKYANKARENLGEDSRYKDVAFASGLIFDFLFHLQRSTYIDLGKARYDDAIETGFTAALEQAKRIIVLSKYKKKLPLEKFGPATAFMRSLAQIAITMLKQADAVDFYKKLENQKPSEPIKLAIEMKRFQTNSAIVATYLAEVFPVFEQLGEAMSVWGFPYLSWLDGKKEVHDLAGMGMLGVMVTGPLKGAAFGAKGDPAVPMPELKFLEFTVTPQVINEIKI